MRYYYYPIDKSVHWLICLLINIDYLLGVHTTISQAKFDTNFTFGYQAAWETQFAEPCYITIETAYLTLSFKIGQKDRQTDKQTTIAI